MGVRGKQVINGIKKTEKDLLRDAEEAGEVCAPKNDENLNESGTCAPEFESKVKCVEIVEMYR